MKIKKMTKNIKKFFKKLTRRFSGKNNEEYQAAALQAQAAKPQPFVSVFASMKVQKAQKSIFLMAGNDISKINSDACMPLCPQSKNETIDVSVKVEVKNRDSF